MSLEDRGRMIDIIRRICNDRREELGRMELEETKVGRLDHKILKLTNMRYVLGVEAMRARVATPAATRPACASSSARPGASSA